MIISDDVFNMFETVSDFTSDLYQMTLQKQYI